MKGSLDNLVNDILNKLQKKNLKIENKKKVYKYMTMFQISRNLTID
jgi:hypothetical protein